MHSLKLYRWGRRLEVLRSWQKYASFSLQTIFTFRCPSWWIVFIHTSVIIRSTALSPPCMAAAWEYIRIGERKKELCFWCIFHLKHAFQLSSYIYKLHEGYFRFYFRNWHKQFYILICIALLHTSCNGNGQIKVTYVVTLYFLFYIPYSYLCTIIQKCMVNKHWYRKD